MSVSSLLRSTSAHTSGAQKRRVTSLCSSSWPRIPFSLSRNPAALHSRPHPQLQLLWRFPPGFTCCHTASSPWGLSRLGGPPPRPLLLTGSKMELPGEACGIWDLRPLPEKRTGVSSPSHNFPRWLSGSADPCRPQRWLVTEVILGGGGARFWNGKRGAVLSLLTPCWLISHFSFPPWVGDSEGCCLWEATLEKVHKASPPSCVNRVCQGS